MSYYAEQKQHAWQEANREQMHQVKTLKMEIHAVAQQLTVVAARAQEQLTWLVRNAVGPGVHLAATAASNPFSRAVQSAFAQIDEAKNQLDRVAVAMDNAPHVDITRPDAFPQFFHTSPG